MDWETYWKSRWQQNISAASEDAYISHYESDLGRSARERQLEYLADEGTWFLTRDAEQAGLYS